MVERGGATCLARCHGELHERTGPERRLDVMEMREAYAAVEGMRVWIGRDQHTSARTLKTVLDTPPCAVAVADVTRFTGDATENITYPGQSDTS